MVHCWEVLYLVFCIFLYWSQLLEKVIVEKFCIFCHAQASHMVDLSYKNLGVNLQSKCKCLLHFPQRVLDKIYFQLPELPLRDFGRSYARLRLRSGERNRWVFSMSRVKKKLICQPCLRQKIVRITSTGAGSRLEIAAQFSGSWDWRTPCRWWTTSLGQVHFFVW